MLVQFAVIRRAVLAGRGRRDQNPRVALPQYREEGNQGLDSSIHEASFLMLKTVPTINYTSAAAGQIGY